MPNPKYRIVGNGENVNLLIKQNSYQEADDKMSQGGTHRRWEDAL